MMADPSSPTEPPASICPDCGSTVPPDAPGGNCPVCLWSLASAALEDVAPRERRPRRFGAYQLVEEIARGGMGVVWRARQEGLGRDVALKMVVAGHLATSSQVLRFYTEAKAAARLNHPNIVPIFEIGEEEGCHFYSMRLMEGRSLAAALKEDGVPPKERAARLVATVSRAIHFAHQRGVLHRDVKPSNLLLDADGEPHVVDFGLARLAEDSSGATRTDAILGTPAYMAPEQAGASAREVTTAADVYGLGAVLHELLTGQPPFAGGTPLETVRRVLGEAPPPARSLNPAVHRDLEVICLKCLQKEPERRYASAAELADDLERWLAGQPILARPITSLERLASWARRKPELATALAALSVVLALAFAVSLALYLRVRSESEARAAALRSEEGQRLAFQSLAVVRDNPGQALLLALEAAARAPSASANNALLASLESCHERRRFLGHTWTVNHAAFSPDGERVVTASDDGTARIWNAATGETIAVLKGHGRRVATAVFDAQGKRALTASSDATARIWDAQSGAELVVISGHAHALKSAAFSPDGQRVLTVSQNTARLWDARSGAALRVLDQHQGEVMCGRFSPHGAQVVTGSLDGTAMVWEVETGTRLATLSGHLRSVLDVRHSPDGLRIATGGEDGACVWDARTGANLAVLRGHTHGVYSVAWTPDGSLLATGSEDFTARIWEAQSGKQLHVLRHGHKVISVAISADGALVLTACYDKKARLWDARSGALVSELKGHAAPIEHATFSPSSREAVTACVDFTARLWTVRPSAPLVVATEADPGMTCVDLAPDGKALVAGDGRGTLARIVELGTGRELVRLEGHEGTIRAVAFSPDGSMVLTGSDGGSARLWEARSGQPLRTWAKQEGKVGIVAFSPDGRWLAAAWEAGSVSVMDARSKEEQAAFRCRGGVLHARFSPDGEHLAMTADTLVLTIGDIASGAQRELPLEGIPQVYSAEFGAGGKTLITTAFTTRTSIHSFPDGASIGALIHSSRSGNAWSSADGSSVATLEDESVAIWDLATREERLEIRRTGFRPIRACISRDSSSILVLWNKAEERSELITTVVLYPLDVLAEARRIDIGQLTPDERDRFKVGSAGERRAHREAWRGGQVYGEMEAR